MVKGHGEPDDAHTPDSPQTIVAEGYDRIGAAYEQWTNGLDSGQRERHAAILVRELGPGSSLLDLGCASGRLLAQGSAAGLAVTGVDISTEQIALARDRVPGATLVVGDMTRVDFPRASFDGVAAFYSVTHVPRSGHARLFQCIYKWLRPRGLFVASLGSRHEPGSVEDDWLGVPMYFSHWDAETNKKLVAAAGFDLASAIVETTEEDGQPVSFLWMLARKPG